MNVRRASPSSHKTLWGAVRSELKRLNRRSFVGVGAGLVVLFAVVGTAVVFLAGDGIREARMPPGMGVPVDVESSRGVVAGLAMATDLIGILSLSLWAAATASDYSTGWIRLMVQAEPRRWRLLAAKLSALTGFTVIGTIVAAAVVVAFAYPMAGAAGVSTSAWSEGMAGTIWSGWLNLSFSVVVWGIIGLSVATIARSAVVAIAGGIGYLVVFEGVVGFASEDLTKYLPGSMLTAVGAGGTPQLDYPTAALLASAFAITALAVTGYVFRRRDITS